MTMIGIDFGTSKSCAAVVENGVPKILTDSRGRRSLPSVVLVDPEDRLSIGWDAINNPLRYSSRSFSISSVKRLTGTNQERQWGSLKTYPHEISALIIATLKLRANTHCGLDVGSAVVAVPAHFDIHQRWATIQAAEIAGFSFVRLLNEATAAVIACKHKSRNDEPVLVFDFGAGTLDVSVVRCGEGVFEVEACPGDDRLGGDDFDHEIIRLITEHVEKHFGKYEFTPMQELVLRETAAQAKHELSTVSETTICIPGFLDYQNGLRDLNLRVDRPTFEDRCRPLFDRAQRLLEQGLNDSGRTPDGISECILVGGSSRIPYVQKMVRTVMGRHPRTVLDPETGVAEGAAILAATLDGRNKDFLLLDVTHASYSVGVKGDIASPLIPKYTTVPTRHEERFTNTEDNQSELSVCVYQGEHPKSSQNTYVGKVRLTGLPLAKAGTAQFQVCFDIDASNTLSVKATDLATGNNVTARMDSPYRLNPAQLKVLQKKVEKEIAHTRAAESAEHEAEAQHTARSAALELSNSIASFTKAFGTQMSGDREGLLQSGRLLLSDYVAAGASVSSLTELASSVEITYREAASTVVINEIASIADAPELLIWKDSAARQSAKCEVSATIAGFEATFSGHLETIRTLLRSRAGHMSTILACCPPTILPLATFVLTHLTGAWPDPTEITAMRKHDRHLLRLLLLSQIANTELRAISTGALRNFVEEFKGADCVFLLDYLSPSLSGAVRAALEVCLTHVPAGSWRKAWKEAEYDAAFLTREPIVRKQLLLETLTVLRCAENNPHLHSLAIDDLQRLGGNDAVADVAVLLQSSIDDRSKVRLISFLGGCDGDESTKALLYAITMASPDISTSAIKLLQSRRTLLQPDFAYLAERADRIFRDHRALGWRERIALWRIGRRHPDVRNVVQFLVRNRRSKAV